MSGRPRTLALVLGTGTEVGKTWVTCRVLEHLRGRGVAVAARKPVQSWDPDEVAAGQRLDADLLAEASGERSDEVCRPARSYSVAVAPPMAAARLGVGPLRLADLVAEITWGDGIDVGLVEAAGGVRSPVADDGDGIDLEKALRPDLVVLVADAGLGTIHAVRSSSLGLDRASLVVHLNRYDEADQLRRENRAWLAERDGFTVTTDVPELAALLSARSVEQN